MAATTEKRREVLSDWSAEELEAVVYALEVEEAIPKVRREIKQSVVIARKLNLPTPTII